MARVISIEEGADGVVKTTTSIGSLFVFRAAYLEPVCSYCGLEGTVSLAPGDDIDDKLLSVLTEVMAADYRAIQLLARAEQYRRGLERKLSGRSLSGKAGSGLERAGNATTSAVIAMVLDRLESEGLLSDQRYAEAWMRQRVRRHPEGPLSMAAALASRGLERTAVREALASFYGAPRRFDLLVGAVSLLKSKLKDSNEVRPRLLEMGWRSTEISECLLACSSDA